MLLTSSAHVCGDAGVQRAVTAVENIDEPWLAEESAVDSSFLFICYSLAPTSHHCSRCVGPWGKERREVLLRFVDYHLPGLVEELQRLGFGVHGGNQLTARLPLSDEFATLSLLREAAETVGLPAARLLEICLVAAVKPREGRKRRRRRSPTIKASSLTRNVRRCRRRS